MWHRRSWWVVAGLGLVLSGLGCEQAAYDRAPYAVGAVAGVLYSNVLVVTGELKPSKRGQSLVVSYPLLFQNESAEPAQVGLADASALLNGAPQRAAASCVEHGRSRVPTLELPPGRRSRVDCELTLTAAGLADARRSDSELTLTLPVLSAGRVQAPEFTFRLRLEDAS